MSKKYAAVTASVQWLDDWWVKGLCISCLILGGAILGKHEKTLYLKSQTYSNIKSEVPFSWIFWNKESCASCTTIQPMPQRSKQTNARETCEATSKAHAAFGMWVLATSMPLDSQSPATLATFRLKSPISSASVFRSQLLVLPNSWCSAPQLLTSIAWDMQHFETGLWALAFKVYKSINAILQLAC